MRWRNGLVSIATLFVVAVLVGALSCQSDTFSATGDGGFLDSAPEDASVPETIAAPVDASGPCPKTPPESVLVDGGAYRYCMDQSEVTTRQYQAFLAANVSLGNLPPSCDFKTSYSLGSGTDRGLDVPVTYVDWCDALAYCTWAGKRLCGAVPGGGPYTSGQNGSPRSNEWLFACTGGGARGWPYGAASSPERCNAAEREAGAPLPADASPQCTTPEGIGDLLGNVWEWVNQCNDAGTRPNDVCAFRGGTWAHSDAVGCAWSSGLTRASALPDVGFRCCADAR